MLRSIFDFYSFYDVSVRDTLAIFVMARRNGTYKQNYLIIYYIQFICMVTDAVSDVNLLATVFTIVVGWVTVVRWTRDSKEETMRELRRQFWINHSVDLRYGVGTGPERSFGEKKLVIRGLEIYDYGWWFSPHDGQYREVDRLREIKLRSTLTLKKIAYGLYRNLRLGAPLRMNCSLLIEPEKCQISIFSELVMEDGRVIGGRGDQITDTLPEIRSFSEISQNEKTLYKIGLNTYDYYEADEIVRMLTQSNHIKDPDLNLPQ